MIRAHTLRAAGLGAEFTALTCIVAGVAFAAYVSGLGAGGDINVFGARLLTAVPLGLLAGALAGLIIFGVIGFFVALLGIKRVGWTFTYTLFGAILAGVLVQPFVTWFASVLTTAELTAFAHAALITLAAMVTGAIAGFLVAVGLKAGLDA